MVPLSLKGQTINCVQESSKGLVWLSLGPWGQEGCLQLCNLVREEGEGKNNVALGDVGRKRKTSVFCPGWFYKHTRWFFRIWWESSEMKWFKQSDAASFWRVFYKSIFENLVSHCTGTEISFCNWEQSLSWFRWVSLWKLSCSGGSFSFFLLPVLSQNVISIDFLRDYSILLWAVDFTF